MKRNPMWIRVIALTLLLIALLVLVIYQTARGGGEPSAVASTVSSSQPEESGTESASSAEPTNSAIEPIISASPEPNPPESITEREELTMKITANGNSLTAVLTDNSSARALMERLESEPISVEMHDYGNFEKVGPLGFSLPTNDEPITTQPGDVILYQGSNITVYYDTNQWTFTRLGRIENMTREDLLDFFGDGNVTVTFSLD